MIGPRYLIDVIGVAALLVLAGCGEALEVDARRVLATNPKCANLTIEPAGKSRVFERILVLNGSTKTENDKFDCVVALWTHMKTQPAGIFNNAWSEEYRDQRVREALRSWKPAPPCNGTLIHSHPTDVAPKCEPFGFGSTRKESR